MSGWMVPEVQCDWCGLREQADAEHTLRGLRSRLASQGWILRRLPLSAPMADFCSTACENGLRATPTGRSADRTTSDRSIL